MAGDANGGSLPPPSEEVHLPDPSYLPALTALGITLAVTGVILTPVLVGIGLVIAVVAIVRWIRQTREEMAELPLEQ
ncbi:MAG: hypothetical protein QOJ14_832 [Thermoleophilaceae bacterium]|nr:hypothetical protein [Thermoleophilaceae bacterium]